MYIVPGLQLWWNSRLHTKEDCGHSLTDTKLWMTCRYHKQNNITKKTNWYIIHKWVVDIKLSTVKSHYKYELSNPWCFYFLMPNFSDEEWLYIKYLKTPWTTYVFSSIIFFVSSWSVELVVFMRPRPDPKQPRDWKERNIKWCAILPAYKKKHIKKPVVG